MSGVNLWRLNREKISGLQNDASSFYKHCVLIPGALIQATQKHIHTIWCLDLKQRSSSTSMTYVGVFS